LERPTKKGVPSARTSRASLRSLYHFLIAAWRTKAAESGRTPMNTSRKLLTLIVLVAFVVILFVIGNNQNP
jgi:hypothetical protein